MVISVERNSINVKIRNNRSKKKFTIDYYNSPIIFIVTLEDSYEFKLLQSNYEAFED